MGIGTSLVLIAVGAILRYAVANSFDAINLPVVGLILMIVGVIGLLITLFLLVNNRDRGVARDRDTVVRDRDRY